MWNPETNIKGPKGDKGDKGDPGPGGASITIADTPPVGLPGAMWWESDSGTLFIRYDDGSSEQWVQAAATVSSGGGGGVPSDTIPAMDGVAAAGVGTEYARGDHVHPSDTSKANTVHSHVIADTTGLQTALDAKANTTHTHAVSDTAGLQTALDGKVFKTGDTMTGNLNISKADPALTLTKTAVVQNNSIFGNFGALNRWQMILGDVGAESGGNAGSDFALHRFDDAGAWMGPALSIYRDTGVAVFSGDLGITKASPSFALDTTGASTNATIWGRKNGANRWVMQIPDTAVESGSNVGSDWTLSAFLDNASMVSVMWANRASQVVGFAQPPTAPTPTAGDSSTKLATTAFVTAADAGKVSKTGDFVSGDLTIYRAGATTTGAIYFGSTGLKYLYYDGVGWNLTGGNITIAGFITAGHGGIKVNTTATAGSVIYQVLVEGNPGWAGINMQAVHTTGAWAGFRFAVNGPFFEFRGDGIGYNSGGGMWGSNSDARVKNVLGDYTSGLAAICALKPMRYKYKGNETDDEPSHWPTATTEEEKAKNPAPNEAPTAPYKNSPHYGSARDDIEYIGLLAQDAEVPMPELVSKQKGYIDGTAVDDLRMMNATPMIYALVNAVKELKAEIDTLKAALATKEAR